MALKDRKVLFFIAGTFPNVLEQALIDNIVGKVFVRSLLADTTFGGTIEACDAVALSPSSSLPDAYSEKDDVTPKTGAREAILRDGASVPILTDVGTAAAFASTQFNLTAQNNGAFDPHNALLPGLEIEVLSQKPIANKALEVSVRNIEDEDDGPVFFKCVSVKLATDAGVKQKETATVVGSVTASVAQVETATAAGTVVTATPQVETATAAGTVSGDGNAAVVVTGAGIAGSPVTLAVAVLNGDTPTLWAAKVRTAINANAAIAALYTAGGTGTAIVLTRNAAAANDGTLNISLATGTATGITTAATSANTTAGIAADGTGLAKVVVTAAGLAGSPITVPFSVAAGDTATLWAAKARAALLRNTTITDFFTVGGSTTAIILTKRTAEANDATLNMALDNDTSVGITTAASSADTTAGVAGGAGNATVVITSAAIVGSPLTVSVPVCAGDTASQVAEKIRNKLNLIPAIVGDGLTPSTTKFTVSGSGATVVLERYIAAANDGTLNIATDNGTCTGLTTAATSANTTAGAIVANATTVQQMVDAINAHPEASDLMAAQANGGEEAGLAVPFGETTLDNGTNPTVDVPGAAQVRGGVILGTIDNSE